MIIESDEDMPWQGREEGREGSESVEKKTFVVIE